MRDDDVLTTVESRRLPRMPTLDGVRAFAVVLTSLVHVAERQVPGGFLGVDIFFVLSGFLITSILLSSVQDTGRIDLRAFYVRRVRRLLPAVVLLLVVFTGVVVLSSPTHRQLLVAAVVDAGVLLYAFNWSDAFDHQPPWQMDHLWSLSLEEQFYLLWPLLLIVAVARLSRREILTLTAVAAALSSVAQGWTYVSTRSIAWAYLSTPLHASGILVACLLGQMYTWGMAERPLQWLSRRVWPAWVALGVIVVLSLTLGQDDTTTYVGGMLLAVLAAAVLLANMVAQDRLGLPSRLRSLMSSRVVVAVGKRSYSLYLWQNFMAWALVPIRTTLWYVPANFVTTALAAELSYRFVERRFTGRPTRRPAPTSNPAVEPASASG